MRRAERDRLAAVVAASGKTPRRSGQRGGAALVRTVGAPHHAGEEIADRPVCDVSADLPSPGAQDVGRRLATRGQCPEPDLLLLAQWDLEHVVGVLEEKAHSAIEPRQLCERPDRGDPARREVRCAVARLGPEIVRDEPVTLPIDEGERTQLVDRDVVGEPGEHRDVAAAGCDEHVDQLPLAAAHRREDLFVEVFDRVAPAQCDVDQRGPAPEPEGGRGVAPV